MTVTDLSDCKKMIQNLRSGGYLMKQAN